MSPPRRTAGRCERQRRVPVSAVEMLRFAQQDMIESKPIKVNQNSWFLNLVANPIVTVELFWKHRMYKAEQVSNEEERKASLAQFPYGLVDAYQELTTRTIPVIRLHPL